MYTKPSGRTPRSSFKICSTPSVETSQASHLQDKSLPPETPQQIKDLISSLSNAQNLDETLHLLDTACRTIEDFKEVNRNTFFYKGYHINASLQFHTDTTAQVLCFANKVGIHSAPKLVEHIKVQDGSSVIITFYRGCENGVPNHFSRENNDATKRAASEQFVTDMEKLASLGFIHPHASRGPESWFINSHGEIILDDWNRLNAIQDETDKDALIDYLKEILN